MKSLTGQHKCHNPYFNRWFSAIKEEIKNAISIANVTILILIDGFLQCENMSNKISRVKCHNPYFNRWFSAILMLMKIGLNCLIVTILILIDGFLQ